MSALVMREAERIAGAGGFGAALWLHAAWLSSFLAVWGGSTGVPLIPGMPVYEQLLRVQWMLMVFLLPWAAARMIPLERGDALVRTAARLGLRPSRIVAARIIALSAALLCVVAAGLPMAVLAHRMSDVPLQRALADQSMVAACAIAAATMVTALQQALASRIRVWLVATASSCLLAWAVTQGSLPAWMVAVALAIAGLVGAGLIASRGDASLRYLSESPA
jgi:hypothetical protein